MGWANARPRINHARLSQQAIRCEGSKDVPRPSTFPRSAAYFFAGAFVAPCFSNVSEAELMQ